MTTVCQQGVKYFKVGLILEKSCRRYYNHFFSLERKEAKVQDLQINS
jgi:hypothetical protein